MKDNPVEMDLQKLNKALVKKVISMSVCMVLLTIIVLIKPRNIEALNPIFYSLATACYLLLMISMTSLLTPFQSVNKTNAYFQTSDYLTVFISACLFFQVVSTFFFFKATVDGSSMEPNLHEGNAIITRVEYDKQVDNFDVVVVVYEAGNQASSMIEDGELLVKRVIGKPGDTFYYENGNLYLNGHLTEESYLLVDDDFNYPFVSPNSVYNNPSLAKFADQEGIILDSNGVYRIDEGYYFLMGDHRNVSVDSRVLGLFKSSQIVGVVKYHLNSLFDWEKVS